MSDCDFGEIYQEHFQGVYRYLLSLCRDEAVAEELTQETFFKALQAIDGFDGTCKLYVWLCQIAKNTYFSAYKADRRLDRSAADTRVGSGPEGALLHRESAMEAHQALHRLTDPYKEVFSLRLFGELSFAQIGALFGKTESWARVTYHRARLKIREDLP